MTTLKKRNALAGAAILLAGSILVQSCSDRESLPLIINLSSTSVSKLPFVIAMDQGLYAKHGLNVEIRMPSPESDGRMVSHGNFWGRLRVKLGLERTPQADINVGGAIPMIVHVSERGAAQKRIVIGATDCVIRAHITGRNGITRIEDLKGGRIGVTSLGATTGYQALLLAQRMGWDPRHDLSILIGYEGIDGLLDGSLDALVASEHEIAEAKAAGLPTLLELRVWNEPIAGNSAQVSPGWLDDPSHREAARRFLRALSEAIALFHQRPDLARAVMSKWYGIADPESARIFYEQGAWIPRKPFPCYEGIEKGMALHDSNEMRRYKPADFYDDSILREIDASGFIDGLYRN